MDGDRQGLSTALGTTLWTAVPHPACRCAGKATTIPGTAASTTQEDHSGGQDGPAIGIEPARPAEPASHPALQTHDHRGGESAVEDAAPPLPLPTRCSADTGEAATASILRIRPAWGYAITSPGIARVIPARP